MANLDPTPPQEANPSNAVPPAATEGPVTVTAKAINMIKITRQEEGHAEACGLRVAVRGGGCSGFEYALDFENEARDNDVVYYQGDLRILIDPISARYLQGTEIDYQLGMSGAGFKFNNPNAIGTCGCGSSFTV